MKYALILCVMANNAFSSPPIVARITPDALAKLQHDNPMALLKTPAKAETNVRRPNDQSIINESTILHDGKNWTLVPKGAVIHLPDAMKNRIVAKPTGTLLEWSEFLAINRAWITTNEISFDQAAGKKPLQPERVAFWAKQDKVVIAVHQSGPISVLTNNVTQSPPKP